MVQAARRFLANDLCDETAVVCWQEYQRGWKVSQDAMPLRRIFRTLQDAKIAAQQLEALTQAAQDEVTP